MKRPSWNIIQRGDEFTVTVMVPTEDDTDVAMVREKVFSTEAECMKYIDEKLEILYGAFS